MTRKLLPRPVHDAWQQGRHADAFEAVGLFVDLSGFTVMTQRLMTRGRVGSELLARAVEDVFEPMVEAVESHGGWVSGFAGDAFTALFPNGPCVPERALAAARHIRRVVADEPVRLIDGEEHTFGVKVGLGAGSATWQVLGDHAGARVLSVSGPAIDRASFAEHRAEPGDIVAHDSLGLDLAGRRADADHVVVDVAPCGPVPDPPPGWEPVPSALRDFFPEQLLDEEYQGEFRWVLTAYIQLDDGADLDAVRSFVAETRDLTREYGGYLSRVDFGDKGCTLLMFWGARESSSERPSARCPCCWACARRTTVPGVVGAGPPRRSAGLHRRGRARAP